MTRTWEDNADEYAAKDNGEDWAFVLLVACSVELDAGHGVNDRWQVDDDKDCAVAESLGKVSAVKFAKRAGTSAKRVTRYLQAAVRAADDELIPDPDKLTPNDMSTTGLPDAREHPVRDYYDGTASASIPSS